ncbi:MAG: hypothetical protein OQK04_11280 [Kangiellaceae bacterium]|nr:hypothetical protein [Kangiellaceae bacterium]MCW8999286.1 hypothetical protein [Kangiellaceae bacterium]
MKKILFVLLFFSANVFAGIEPSPSNTVSRVNDVVGWVELCDTQQPNSNTTRNFGDETLNIICWVLFLHPTY